ncbi:MAG TPA: sigma 54-interacting transcriptional regulator [Polyangiaceae bacterium]|nr:sigma 54-interacting transcriptional regulator [Polyangiaceae bacterium]
MALLDEVEDKTRSEISLVPRAGSRARLLAIWEGGYASCLLPESGKVVLGRSLNADLRISSDSVSREHAVVQAGFPPTIEDLGSSNGTRVDGQRLAPGQSVPLTPGRVVEFGNALIVLQDGLTQREPGSSPDVESAFFPPPRVEGKMDRLDRLDRLYRLVDLVATGTLSVILQGETGVGKEVTAERIHERSARAEQPFLKINCAAFAESMVESELFGHERGAFTGAAQAKAGLLESASGGTVLLDEVAELSLPMQAKLLRAVGNAEVLRIGSVKPRTIDVRFIAATNGDFNDLIARGAFRSDLYFRLNGICLTIPPLREREHEIVPLALVFAAESSARLGPSVPNFSESARSWLGRHLWPGNIRELRSVVERAVLLAQGNTIEIEHLQVDPEFSAGALRRFGGAPSSHPGSGIQALDLSRPEPSRPTSSLSPASQFEPQKLRDELDRFERDRIVDAISRCHGNQTKAAALLGISRRTLVHRLDAYELPRPQKGG